MARGLVAGPSSSFSAPAEFSFASPSSKREGFLRMSTGS
eukprot:COSAG04_NODE_5516_length_1588_cov_1.973808_1_plen_38_part_10